MLHLGIRNFKSVRDTQWLNLSRFALIYGNNSSGKSIIKDVLEIGSKMDDGPDKSFTDKSLINKAAFDAHEPTVLTYGVYPAISQWGADHLSHTMFSTIFQRYLNVDLDDLCADGDAIDVISQYIRGSMVVVSYEWIPDHGDTKLSQIGVELASIMDGTAEAEQLLTLSFGKNEATIVFNTAHPLMSTLRSSLATKLLISPSLQLTLREQPCEGGVAGALVEAYAKEHFYNYGELAESPEFLIVAFAALGSSYLVSRSCSMDFIGAVRPVTEASQSNDEFRSPSDSGYWSEYWNGIKSCIFQGRWDTPVADRWKNGSIYNEQSISASAYDSDDVDYMFQNYERLNYWLADSSQLDTGYLLTANFKFTFDYDYLIDVGNRSKGELHDVLKIDIQDASRWSQSEVMLFDTCTERTVSLRDVGTGISQILPVLYSLSQAGLFMRSLYVQQPELHLHPRMQARLAQIFVDSFLLCGKLPFRIIETHSELFVLRVLKVVRRGYDIPNIDASRNLTADDITVIFAMKDGGGSTTYTNLRVSKNGEFLDRWPDGFFEERDKELFGE